MKRLPFLVSGFAAASMACLAAFAQTAAGWRTVEQFPAPKWDGAALKFQAPEGNMVITPLSDDVVRVRLTTASAFGRDHSYAVLPAHLPAPSAKVDIGGDSTTLSTATLRVTIQNHPLRISFSDAGGESLDADDAGRGISFAGAAFRDAKRLRPDEHVYGLGEKNGRLDKRGWQLGGYNYAMWNSDTYKHDSSTDPTYADIPFLMVTRRGQAHGILFDNTWRSSFDIGHENANLLTFGADGGELDYYFINGPTPRQVIERYTALTGRMPLPPLWALGYQQCRYSYFPEARVREVAETLRRKHIPADGIWFDVHFQDGYKPFTWDKDRFPDPRKLIADLAGEGFHSICLEDAHPKVEKGYWIYDQGMVSDQFVKRADGTVYEGPVWPSLAEKNPGPSVFPDFSRASTREWWGGLQSFYTDIGVAGIWNDMNEPSVFVSPSGTMPEDVRHDNDGQPTDHREIHNVYGQLMSRATFEGLSRLRPNERAFVLTRSTFAGGQRYAAVWPGDNVAEWTSLSQSVCTLLGLGVSGFPFVGSDIGGYAGGPTPELFVRWLEVGVFSPFMRVHAEFGSPDKEPWSFGPANEAIAKRCIELRYQLLPHIYNVMEQSSETGLPAMRPLFVEFPGDEAAAAIDDEFLCGADLLIAPVMRAGLTNRAVCLPRGEWFDYWTGRRMSGGTTIQAGASLDTIPVFVRGGAFIFRQPVVQNTEQMPGNPLFVLIAPAADSEASLYEDDGATLNYRNGAYCRRHFHQRRQGATLTLEVSAPEGTFRPAKRGLVLETQVDHEPESVSIDSVLPRVSPAELDGAARGWSYANGVVTVKQSDNFVAEVVTIR